MTGWQRFFLLFLCCIGILICWPQYEAEGIAFLATAFVLWTSIIMLFSVIVNLFAIDKWEFLHRLLSIVFFVVMLISLLYYFPLPDNQTPYSRLQAKQWPTQEDVIKGIERITFSYNFADQTVQKKILPKQQSNKVSDIKNEIKNKIQPSKTVIQQIDKTMEVLVEGEEEEENK